MTHTKQLTAIGLGSLLLCWACLLSGCNSDETTDDAETGGETAGEDGTDGSTGGGTGTGTGGSEETGSGGTATGGDSAGPAGSSSVDSGGSGDGTGGTPLTCPEQGDLASWLPSNPVDPCTKGCGPDKIGWKNCHKTDEEVCSVPPCAQCDLCEYSDPLPPCYETPGDPSLPLPPECPEGTFKSDPCDAPCDGTAVSSLCIHANPSDETKIEGCVCAERGKWACATYNTETNAWN